MAVVRKTLLTLGKHVSPDGETEVTPERVSHWVSTFQKQKQNKIKIPVPWGHQRFATPDNKEFNRSKFNAGYLKDLLVGPDGSLAGLIEAPGLREENGQLVSDTKLDDGTPVKTAIGEVSVGIFPTWKDGKGNQYDDMIGHVALTPLPVWADQDDFQSLGTDEPKVMYFSTVTRMATDDKKTDSEESDLKGQVESVSGKSDDDDEEEGAAKTLDSMFQSPEQKANPEQERISRIINTFAQLATPFPPDTTPENFVERLDTVIGVLAARMQVEKQEDAAEEAEKAKMQQTNPEQPKEEQPPTPQMMLSTVRAIQENPLLKSLLEEKLATKKEQRKARIAALAERGLPEAEVTRLSATPILMSTIIDPTATKLRDDETDRELALLERVLPEKKFAAIYLSTMTPVNLEQSANPLDAMSPVADKKYGNVPVTEADDKAIKERVARVNGRATL